MAGVVVVVTREAGPFRPPALMALLIAPVSSVTPSPTRGWFVSLSSMQHEHFLLTLRSIVHDVAENRVTAPGERCIALMGDIS